jgi:CRISPR type III-B/RAMP module RAMP protein Cmr6
MNSQVIESLRSNLVQLAEIKDPERDEENKLLKTTNTTNFSLWLDRMLHAQLITGRSPRKEHPYITHIKAICERGESSDYREFFQNRWLPSLSASAKQIRIARATGRLVVGLGSESAWENSITLHRTYGVPYIPGSALKGLAAAYAHRFLKDDRWRKAGTTAEEMSENYAAAHKVMFGDTTTEGYVTFFDALYVPNSGLLNQETQKRQALWPDVITVHHPDYYQEKKEGGKLQPPADWDDPNPIPFVSATGEYLIALAGPDDWVKAAFQILEKALSELGVGAKTNSGYGRMDYLTPEKQEQRLKQFEKPKEIRLPRKGDMVTGQCDKRPIRIEVDGERILVRKIDVNLHKLDFQLPEKVNIEFYSIDENVSGGFSGVVQAVDDSESSNIRVFLKRAKKQSK